MIMKKIIITSIISLMLATNLSADTDGKNNLSKKNSVEVKDCFESVNRATFKFNQVLDGVMFEPVADRKSTRLNSSHNPSSRMPSSA